MGLDGVAKAKAGDKAKSSKASKPKVAIKRGKPTSNSSTSASSPSEPTPAIAAAAVGTGGAHAARKRPTKLRAARERRARDRSMDDDADLEDKFSNLSVAAPAFVPGTPFGGSVGGAMSSPITSSSSSRTTTISGAPLLNGRSLAFVTERGAGAAESVKRTPPTKARAPPADESGSGRPNVERRPRRQRIGALGFSKAPGGVQGRVTRQGGGSGAASAAAPSLSLKPRLTDDGSSSSSAFGASAGTVASAFQQRPRSDSAGSDSDYGSDDEVYPEEQTSGAASAFPDRLTLFSQQKHIPKKVSREVVIDTIFDALFAKSTNGGRGARGGGFSAFGDDTGTDTDEPNEEFVKRGLAASLFKDNLNVRLFSRRANETQQEAVERFITPALLHALVTDLRFEDFRTASARIDILRAIHRNFPSKRLPVARALADATHLRLQYVTALVRTAHALSVERSLVAADNTTDHGHGFTELLRYAIEHVGESLGGFGGGAQLSEDEAGEVVRNYLLSLLALWRAHWLDPAGSDDEELISCAGQFVSYLPEATAELLQRLLAHWPSKYPAQEVVAIRMAARVVMSSPPLHSLGGVAAAKLPVQLFSRLARAVQSPHVQVAQEALAFTGCQFAMVHFLGRYDEIYRVVTEAFHANSVGHWHEGVRASSESHFDRALDFAA